MCIIQLYCIQVHHAQLASGYGSHEVVVKVQHRGTKRMMSSDLSNMRLGCRILDAFNVKLGFDLTSVVLEYCEQVTITIFKTSVVD
jgi:predicted unusual protein kinase regulating ubiquinone biosynthesis (AarF/ABC1/UbiB family)